MFKHILLTCVLLISMNIYAENVSDKENIKLSFVNSVESYKIVSGVCSASNYTEDMKSIENQINGYIQKGYKLFGLPIIKMFGANNYCNFTQVLILEK